MLGTITKDPAANKPYTIDWSTFLDGDIILTSRWTIPEGLTVGTDAHTETACQVWLSGGTAGKRYAVTNQITTASGIMDERSFALIVQEQ